MQGAWAEYFTAIDEEGLKRYIRSGNSPIMLLNDINITSEVVVENNKSVVIELNGKTINRGLSSVAQYGHVFKILSGSSLTINGGGIIKGGYTDHGGAINNAGTFILNGGTIRDNHSTNEGAGIWNHNGGIVIINGGVICQNYAKRGGGICNEATLTINGGTIKENEAAYGGGVCSSGTATITGGTITQNKSLGENDRNCVGNGFFYESGTLNMSGNPVISGNLNGNNLFMSEDKLNHLMGEAVRKL